MALATVEDVARSALAALNSSAGHVLAAQWVSERYKELCSRARLRHLRRVGQALLPAAVQVGTVGIVQGDLKVYGDAAALTAWAEQDLNGWFFRARNVWYPVDSFQGAHLTLASPFTEQSVGIVDNFGAPTPPPFVQPNVLPSASRFGTSPFSGGLEASTGGGYKLVKRYLDVPEHVRHFGTFVHMRRRWPIDVITYTELDSSAPDRVIVAGGPFVVAELSEGVTKRRLLEFYPYTPTPETIGFTYWENPPDLKLDDHLPTGIDPHVLKEAVLIDVMRFEMAKAMQASDVNGAALWRNDYRAQTTTWEKKIKEAISQDRGTDDVTLILAARSAAPRTSDIRTAYDEVWSRGARP